MAAMVQTEDIPTVALGSNVGPQPSSALRWNSWLRLQLLWVFFDDPRRWSVWFG